jgi:hypothetical protein
MTDLEKGGIPFPGGAIREKGTGALGRRRRIFLNLLRDLSFERRGETAGVLILGMHRSGTSCLTGMLADFGLSLGDVSTSDGANERGNQESRLIRDVNESLLNVNGGAWDRPVEIKHVPWLHRARANQLKAQLSRSGVMWGIKDPRTLLCIALWSDIDAYYVGTFRHPAAVIASLSTRHPERRTQREWENVWYEYNRHLIDLYRAKPFPVVDFDWNADRYRAAVRNIARWLGLKHDAETFFADELRRQRSSDEIENPVLRAAYRELLEIAETEEKKLASALG